MECDNGHCSENQDLEAREDNEKQNQIVKPSVAKNDHESGNENQEFEIMEDNETQKQNINFLVTRNENAYKTGNENQGMQVSEDNENQNQLVNSPVTENDNDNESGSENQESQVIEVSENENQMEDYLSQAVSIHDFVQVFCMGFTPYKAINFSTPLFLRIIYCIHIKSSIISDGVTIKIPYRVDVLLHQPASYPKFPFWVG